MAEPPLVVGITGASGAAYAVRLLEVLLLACGLLQTGVLLGVDLRETSQLLPQPAQFFLEVVAAAALGLEGFAEAVST